MPRQAPYGEGTGIHVEWVSVRRRTLYTIVTLLVVLGAGGGGLYWWMNSAPFDWDTVGNSQEEEPSVNDSARFVELDGTVKIREAGRYEWADAELATALRRGDTVRTVGKSSARIRLIDGTEYLVKPDTIFMIEIMHEDPRTRVREVAVKLTSGQVNLQTPRQNVAGSRSELATPTSEATFDELTVADVAYDEKRRVSDFAVIRGGTRVRAGDQEVTLESSQAVEVSGDSDFSEIIQLPGIPVLESPAHLSRLFYPNPSRATTELRWSSVRQARRYHVELDRTPNFTEPREYRVPEVRVLVPGLMPGTYYWRVSAIDAEDREGGFTDFAKFTVTRQAAKVVPPKLRLSQPSVSLEGLVTINGLTDPDAVVTVNDERVEVKPDGSFRHYSQVDRPGRHPFVVKALKRSGGTAEKTIYATVGSN